MASVVYLCGKKEGADPKPHLGDSHTSAPQFLAHWVFKFSLYFGAAQDLTLPLSFQDYCRIIEEGDPPTQK